MKTPIVTITTGASASLEKFYQATLDSIDARYHQGGNSFPVTHETEREAGERISMTSYAEHASDGVIVSGHMASTDGGRTWQHIERLIK